MTTPDKRDWHRRATNIAKTDCWLLRITSRDAEPSLALIENPLRDLLTAKLDSLANDAHRSQCAGRSERELHAELASTIWNFLKPWKREDVPRGTSQPNTQHQTSEVTS